MNKKELVQTVIEGMRQADNDYRGWTGGNFISNGAEGYMESVVAQKIMQHQNAPKYLFLEYTRNSIKQTDTIKGRASVQFPQKARIDIAILNKDFSLEYGIELKVRDERDKIKRDIERLMELRKKLSKEEGKGSMRAGLLGLFKYASGKDEDTAIGNLQNNIDKLHDDLVESYGDALEFYPRKLEFSEHEENENGTLDVGTYICIVV